MVDGGLGFLQMIEHGHKAYFKFDTQSILLVAPGDTMVLGEHRVPLWGATPVSIVNQINEILDKRDQLGYYFKRGPRNEVIPVCPVTPPVEPDPQLPLFSD